MGSGFSTLFPCFTPVNRTNNHQHDHQPADLIFASTEPLDETLGHSFCYVRSSNRFLSPTHSDRFLSPSSSLRFSPSHESGPVQKSRTGSETGFKTISGASVSANTSTPRTVLQLDNIYDDATDSTLGGGVGYGVKSSIVNANGFESTSSFSALPLQPVARRAGGERSGRIDRGGYFMSGPMESGAMSGPLDVEDEGSDSGRLPFSAPLGNIYMRNKKKKRIKGFRWYGKFAEKKQPWVAPVVMNLVSGWKENSVGSTGVVEDLAEKLKGESDVQWALGKAGEDRVHVVVSEEQGWLFVGIYDGFNGPDAPEFLMGNLYRAVYNELQGLFWEIDEQVVEQTNLQIPTTTTEPDSGNISSSVVDIVQESKDGRIVSESDPSIEKAKTHPEESVGNNDSSLVVQEKARRVTFQSEETEIRTRRTLRDFLNEPEEGLDLSGADRFAFSVDDVISVGNSGSAVSRSSLLLSKLKQGLSKRKEGSLGKKLFPWRFGLEEKEKTEVEERVEERVAGREGKRKVGPIDHELVLAALSRALETTELAYLDMTDKVLDINPELALMGSCLLVALMRNEDVYVMNLGDSRAIVAQLEREEVNSVLKRKVRGSNGSSMEGITSDSLTVNEKAVTTAANEASSQVMRLTPLQLSTDHSTSIEEEVIRIKNEHPDDSQCIVNDRVKGRLKVTRAFGAGSLKQPKWNDALLEMFRNEYIGTAPYISCLPSLRHHTLCPRDQFLILSSDGLYQYLSNQEVVSLVDNFMEKFPDGDPAQHLIEELLLRAAKKAGMNLDELLDIPQGDRRKYHDDVTVMVVSLEGRIWKSSG